MLKTFQLGNSHPLTLTSGLCHLTVMMSVPGDDQIDPKTPVRKRRMGLGVTADA
jgi:hypothetical protein